MSAKSVKSLLRVVGSGGAILCAHSITTQDLPSGGAAHVTLATLERFVRLSRHLGELVPLGELIRRHRQGRRTAGLIALTFDDAYAALHAELKKLISREAVPAAIFAVSGAAADGARYWWDRIEDLFPRTPPDRWRAFEDACGLPAEYRQGQPRDLGPLRPLRQWLLAAYAGRWPCRLEPALASLETEVGYRTLQRSMTFDELADLAALPGVEVGVHTASHPVLPLLSDPELHDEIATSFAALRERFESTLPVLAIPFGLYDERTLQAARSAGMVAALTLLGRPIDGRTDAYALPRLCLMNDHSRIRIGLQLFGIASAAHRGSGRRLPRYPELPSCTT